MRGTRRLLLLIALWAAAGAAVALPAHAEQVQQCALLTGRLVVSPGLTHVPANQTITAHGRMSGCSSGGGSATFAATIQATQVTCSTFAAGWLPADVAFGWADHQSTIAALTFTSPPGSPNKVVLFGKAVSGAAVGSRVAGGLRMSVEAPPPAALGTHAGHARGRQQLVPLVGRANACSPASPITTIDIANFEGFALGTPRVLPTPKPAAPDVGPGSAHPPTTATSASSTTSTSAPTTTTTKRLTTSTRPGKARPRRRPVSAPKRVAVSDLGSPGPTTSGSFATPDAVLAVGVAGGSVVGLGLLFFRRSRLVRTAGTRRVVR